MRRLIAVLAVAVASAYVYYLAHNDKLVRNIKQSTIAVPENNIAKRGYLAYNNADSELVVEEGSASRRVWQNDDYWYGHTPDEIEKAKKRELVFSRSRMPNEKGTISMLKEALDTGIISKKEYYGELAHVLSDELSDPRVVIKGIVESGNSYSIEVMFMTIQDAPWYNNLTEKDKDEIFSWLVKNKPAFTTEISTMSMSDVYRYENWLASTEKFYKKTNYIDYLDEFVLRQAEDPREFFALIYSGDYQKLLAAGKLRSVAYIDKVVNVYQASYPGNTVSKMILSKRPMDSH